MPAHFRRLTIASAAVLLALAAFGCGGTNKKVPVFPPITQDAADDIMQEFAMVLSLDHGGWLVEIDSTLSAVPAQGVPPFVAPGSAQSFMAAAISYNIGYAYTAANGDTNAAWADTDRVAFVDGNSVANGTLVVDSTFSSIPFYHEGSIGSEGYASGDTISFSGSGFDSLLITFRPVFRGGTRYASTSIFTDYDLVMLRDPVLHPHPISGTMNADVLDAVRTNSDPGSTNGDSIDGTIDVTFDGTQVAHAAVYNGLQDNPTKFFYTFDLKTGVIARQ
jgi:hypothetical protein